jgi:excisionase family DNA binding protein
MKTAALSQSPRLIGVQEAARYIGISVTTLYKGVSQRKIPYIKMGKLVKFDPIKLDEWIKQQTVMPMPERRT